MTKYLLASAAALAMMGGVAVAQTTTSETRTDQYNAPIAAPPVGTLSTSHITRTIDANGKQTDTSETTYKNTAGVADDRLTTTTTRPAPAEVTTYSKSTTTTTTTN